MQKFHIQKLHIMQQSFPSMWLGKNRVTSLKKILCQWPFLYKRLLENLQLDPCIFKINLQNILSTAAVVRIRFLWRSKYIQNFCSKVRIFHHAMKAKHLAGSIVRKNSLSSVLVDPSLAVSRSTGIASDSKYWSRETVWLARSGRVATEMAASWFRGARHWNASQNTATKLCSKSDTLRRTVSESGNSSGVTAEQTSICTQTFRVVRWHDNA